MEQTGTPIVKFEKAAVTNGEISIVEDIDLEIKQGEFVYLIGKVGSGKTTIIRTLTGENPLASGNIRVGGFNLSGLKKKQIPYLRRSIGVVFQDFQLLMDRTIEDNLSFVLRSIGWRNESLIQGRIEEVLNLVGLGFKAHKMPHQLSGGEQQRAAIARALLNNPPLVLADEPTGNLDDETAHSIMNLLFEINRMGTSILMVTHNRQLVQEYPARVLVVENGTCKDE